MLSMCTFFWSYFYDHFPELMIGTSFNCFQRDFLVLVLAGTVYLDLCCSNIIGNTICGNTSFKDDFIRSICTFQLLQNKRLTKQEDLISILSIFFCMYSSLCPPLCIENLISPSVHARFIRQDHLCFFFNAHIHSINLDSNLFIYLFTRFRYHSLLFSSLSNDYPGV